MIFYSYRCEKCQTTFDKRVKFSERNNVYCDCGAKAKKQITGPSGIHGANTGQRTGT